MRLRNESPGAKPRLSCGPKRSSARTLISQGVKPLQQLIEQIALPSHVRRLAFDPTRFGTAAEAEVPSKEGRLVNQQLRGQFRSSKGEYRFPVSGHWHSRDSKRKPGANRVIHGPPGAERAAGQSQA